MTSWRDGASQQAQDDLDELLNVVVPFGEQTLERYGELFPYGAAIRVDTEHRDGVALTLLIEYSLERLGGGVTIGDVHVMTGEPFVWESGGG